MDTEYTGSELRKLMEVGVDLTLVLIGAFGIDMFINQNNFMLVFPGLVWGVSLINKENSNREDSNS